MITRNNYELYIIDFYDGELNKLQVEELHAFLEQHADLKEEFELFSHATIEIESVVFADKNCLKKPEVSDNNILIAYFENDLTSAEKKKVEHQIKANPKMAQELEVIKKTRLLPDYTILFADKNSLKHTAKVISFTTSFYRNLSIAASVILIVIAYFIFRPEANEKMIANDDQKEVVPVQSPSENRTVTPFPLAGNNDAQKNNVEKQLAPSNERKISTPSNYAERNKKSKNNSVENNIKQQGLPENNFAVLPENGKQENVNVIEQKPLAINLTQRQVENKKEIQVTDLREIFSKEELAELGFANNTMAKPSQSGNILDYATTKLKRFSDSKDIEVVKKEDYADDATTYAVNVGEKFSVSHTRKR